MTTKRERKGRLATRNGTTEAEARMVTTGTGFVISGHKVLSCLGNRRPVGVLLGGRRGRTDAGDIGKARRVVMVASGPVRTESTPAN